MKQDRFRWNRSKTAGGLFRKQEKKNFLNPFIVSLSNRCQEGYENFISRCRTTFVESLHVSTRAAC